MEAQFEILSLEEVLALAPTECSAYLEELTYAELEDLVGLMSVKVDEHPTMDGYNVLYSLKSRAAKRKLTHILALSDHS